MKKVKQEKYSDDDGRVYADMSVLDDIAPKFSVKIHGKKRKPKTTSSNIIELTKEEKKAIAKGVIKAHLFYGLLGLVLLCLVFLFIFKIWL